MINDEMNDIVDRIILELPAYNNNYFPEYENASESPVLGSYTCEERDDTLHVYHTVVQPLIYSIVFLLGIVGNGLLLTVLLQRHACLRITEIYLLHLAVADLLLLLGLPFAITQVLGSWVFGDFLCKVMGLLNRLNLVCGSLLLACIGFDRYLAVVHAISSLGSRQPRVVHLTCGLLWLFSLVVGMPNIVFLSVVSTDHGSSQLQCHFHNHHIHAFNWTIASRFLTHLLCFFLPLVVMSYCYIAVVITLRRSQQSLQKQSAIRLAMLVTGVFCLCWLPYNLALLVHSLVQLNILTEESCEARRALAQSLVLTESLGYMHSCLNPILYAFVGVRFRSDLLQLLAKWGLGSACGPLLRVGGRRRVSVSDAATTSTTTTNQYI
ncbi:C-X-C chemokine receptor type 5 [Electrophorus electricus]|uniref:G-protein coupled receptors family 1 profile domain-containing protein n=1 Tax=Electrophorus electricus TaxID=8005 RepID=A0A4W4GP78_ELEEL|nr:C-X-C chemokine receptor type 5 [Electrophorus electricus]XP_026876869.2 C-X-C chemokine receptor type 5 [Electrophorus electricus]